VLVSLVSGSFPQTPRPPQAKSNDEPSDSITMKANALVVQARIITANTIDIEV
jgi:hypothetical protein